MRIAGFLLLACTIVSPSSSGQVISVKREAPVTAVEGQDLYLARNVLRDFFKSERHPECYRVLFSEFEGNLRVDFVPKNSEPILVPEGAVDTSDEPCGRYVGHVVDKRGRVLRRIYSR